MPELKDKLINLITRIELLKSPLSSNREIGNLEKIQDEIREIIEESE